MSQSWFRLPALLAAAAGSAGASYSHLPAMTPAEIWTPLPVQHVTIQGVDVAYVDSGGDGPPLVLVHGLSSYLSFWEHQIPALARDHRVIALDLPGYGQSGRVDPDQDAWTKPAYTPPWYAGIVADLMGAVGAPQAVVVGHSMGGQIAMTLALDHPERVRALVLAGAAGFETFGPGEAAWMKGYWTADRALRTSEIESRAAFTQLVFNRTDDGVERLLQERVRLGKDPSFAGTSVAVSRSIAGMVDWPVASRLSEIRVPTLIVYGSDDRMIPNPVFTGGRTAAIARKGHAAIAGSELVMIPGAGHTVHHDAPEAFNDAVAAFLARLPR